jgi:hypothetical protein
MKKALPVNGLLVQDNAKRLLQSVEAVQRARYGI